MNSVPHLSRRRVLLAFSIAIATDAAQIMLGPAGWTFADEIMDVLAMILLWRLIGFHLLLLPTFAMELIPVADMLPTWTACVAAVISLKQKGQSPRSASKPESQGEIIDV